MLSTIYGEVHRKKQIIGLYQFHWGCIEKKVHMSIIFFTLHTGVAISFHSIPFFPHFSKNRRGEGNGNFEIAISFHFCIDLKNCYFLPFYEITISLHLLLKWWIPSGLVKHELWKHLAIIQEGHFVNLLSFDDFFQFCCYINFFFSVFKCTWLNVSDNFTNLKIKL